jgi:UDP-glucuronate 4-epimerase
MRVLITGGAGAIGSQLVEAFLRRDDEVAVLDSFHDFYPRARKERNLSQARAHSGFARLYEGDIRDHDFVKKAFGEFRPDGVVHLAARAGVRPSVEQPVEYSDVNLNGTAIVLSEAARIGAGRFIFASSSTVYGESNQGAFVEDGDTSHQISPYGATKRGGELLCHAMHRVSELPVTCTRFFSVYGPRQRPDLAISAFAESMLQRRPIHVMGDGLQERDFTFISDILDGVLRAFDRCQGFKIYNLGRGRPEPLNRVIHLLEESLGVRAERETLPVHPADSRRTCASIDLASRELGYDPKVDLPEGIRAHVRWLREEGS